MVVLWSSLASAAETGWLVSPTRWLDAPVSVDPDHPALTIIPGTRRGRWRGARWPFGDEAPTAAPSPSASPGSSRSTPPA
jgi:hypothetical protein